MFIGMLSQRTHHRVEVGNIRANLYDMFKDEASIMVKSFARNIILKLQEDNMLNTTGNLAAQFLKQRLKDEGMTYARPALAAVLRPLDTAAFNNKCVLISACQSYEDTFDFGQGSSYGILSNAIQTILREHRDPIDNFRLVLAVKTLLKNQGFPQHPGLYCGAKKADSVFICY
jgi:hypothetical protein